MLTVASSLLLTTYTAFLNSLSLSLNLLCIYRNINIACLVLHNAFILFIGLLQKQKGVDFQNGIRCVKGVRVS